jgi:hypothetical protein
MEHLAMRLMHSVLAKAEHSHALTADLTRRPAEADRILAAWAGRFDAAIRRIPDLETWCQ